ncbi:NADPH-dependent F420 reductase [Halolamina litorea]|uniref:NADPH-dependent F420 reductase n=1 Tax=Halolamina litorea TaxID=1515593 RepID=A0ABD6BUM8_9EURY|nr:NADPH-dependent F420 reductase [Halolamina litorea]
MDIALLGGTGDIGEGLALRLAYHTNHDVLIGSRDPARAANKAEEYETELDSRAVETTIRGGANADVAVDADVVVVAVPPYYVADTIEAVAESLDEGDIIVSPATGMDRDDDGFHYAPPPAGSVTEHAAESVPDGVELVGAFHNLAAGRLANLDAELGIDTFVVGEDDDAKGIVTDIAEGIEGLRALDAGGIANAAEVESLTPLLVNVAMHNDRLHDLGLELK